MRNGIAYFIKEFSSYIICIVAVLFFKDFFYAPVLVDGDSMYSTLHTNDVMILSKISKRLDGLKRFDIVVVEENNKYLIKRIIALPGETLEYKDNKLYINGEYVEEPFLKDDVKTNNYKLEFKVPEDFYFVMGDNRPVSFDSRRMGCFSINRIKGKANLTIFPFSRFGNKE
jgi:signal peptidase I